MARLLAIDYGRKRVGLAVTDPMQIIANGLDTVAAKDVLDYLMKYVQTEPVECFVVGYPKQLNNEDSESMRYIKPFLGKLKNKFPDIPIEMVDERFTSKIAFQTMIDGGLKKKQRQNKALVDKVSATIILQSYMEAKRNMF
ncbi:Holliday junction resolvase RuvX [Marinifilum sp. N1E240]|uniref:Holliday junction resolvase RuvX n=1 Tax=Marinifilum sp. N1E240 TaxID=2608082 RepID=UPI00128BC925|nr:Holliday junction resolvase RuvX [Marinifilum sp. N1E240]MPQ47423.1 Holliday junction resolvase RuvX [Marinifilum sp. N1E240]